MKKEIIPPADGWRETSYYIVEVSFSPHHVIHRAIFFSGFLNGKDGGPGGHNCLFNPPHEGLHTIDDIYYMKVLRAFQLNTGTENKKMASAVADTSIKLAEFLMRFPDTKLSVHGCSYCRAEYDPERLSGPGIFLVGVDSPTRKIQLPHYCAPGGKSAGGDPNCDHDYPPESRVEHDTWVEWTCSKCGMRRSYEVYD